MTQPVVSTWMYVDDRSTSGRFAQAGGDSSAPEVQAVYWRCVPVFFACARRAHPGECRFALFTNASTLPVVDGADLGTLLDALGVSVVRLPFTYVPPQDFFGSWGNQFYLFDIIRHLRASEVPLAVVLDSDCIVSRPLDAVFRATARTRLLTYRIEYPPDTPVNGLSRTAMRRVFSEMSGREPAEIPSYFGGEIFAASAAALRELEPLVDNAWNATLERHRGGLPKCNEEAHLLSYLYWRLGVPEGTANPHIKRMWTQAEFHNVAQEDLEREIWHVPAEKLYGIRRLFGELRRGRFREIDPGPPFRAYLAAVLGLPRRTPGKRLRDAAERMRRRARRWVRRTGGGPGPQGLSAGAAGRES